MVYDPLYNLFYFRYLKCKGCINYKARDLCLSMYALVVLNSKFSQADDFKHTEK